MSTSDHRDLILALPIAVHDDGRILYYGLERCKRDKVVVVFDSESKGWMRGDEGLRYRVMVTHSDIKGPFPAGSPIKSGVKPRGID